MRSIHALAVVALLPLQVAFAQKVKWGPAPAVFPAGAKMAVMQGDPSKPQLFTVRLDVPKGYRIPAHDESLAPLTCNEECLCLEM
jgi:hypothetical protein